jgi:hypothetical protein
MIVPCEATSFSPHDQQRQCYSSKDTKGSKGNGACALNMFCDSIAKRRILHKEGRKNEEIAEHVHSNTTMMVLKASTILAM